MKPSTPNLPTRSELFDESRLTDDLTQKFYSKPKFSFSDRITN